MFAGFAEREKSTMGMGIMASSSNLICNEKGELLNFMLTRANVDDQDVNVFNRLGGNVFGKLRADKGYISQPLFDRLFNDGIHLVIELRSNMKNKLMPLYDKILLRKRSVIKTINDIRKNVSQLVHSRHRSVFNFCMNVLTSLAAYTFFPKHPAINIEFTADDKKKYLPVIQNNIHLKTWRIWQPSQIRMIYPIEDIKGK